MGGMPAEVRAALDREDAERRAVEDQVERAVGRAKRRSTGPSIVFSIRLGLDEVEALEQRAAEREVPPSVLARALIRTGLRANGAAALSRAVDHLEDAVAELRAAVP
ncbi:hypothetical protein [uncultured Jatrophihabitans sp.]|uniref:hypothetical protein n=1 Tax=uncultured Jatrophihabitans sp. TaxID=1610747 RepID=UPI0035CB82B6